MAKRDIVVIGASAGGVTALRELVESLPADFQASIFIVQHLSPSTPSILPHILSRAGVLKAVHPKDGDPIVSGQIYVSPPDHHMLLENDRILIKKGPKENRFRPSIDALFRSAAYQYGARAIGVVLTGLLNDGTSGMWSIKRMGGLGVVQQPEDAEYPSMPTSVLEYVAVDYITPLNEIASLIYALTQQNAPSSPELTMDEIDRFKLEISIAAQSDAFESGVLEMGNLSPIACPDCSGVLVRFEEGRLIRYRCHTGHAYTASALLSEVSKAVEDSMWKTLRGLEETIMLLEQTSKQFAEADNTAVAERFSEKARTTRELAQSVRKLTYEQEKFSEESLTEKTENDVA